MTYRSVCTGIAAETVAWEPLGFTALSFSEIDPFCCALLKHRYPTVENYGDFTKIQEQEIRADILMGGTPCQSFSVAGKRAGLDDPRGNLAIEFARIALRLRPRWIVWENVKGVLSQDGGRAFAAFLGALEECGYGFAYRVFDAQFDGLAQRRQRVFVVGYLGDWRPPAAVLFERESLRRDLAPCRKAGEEVAGTIGGRAGEGGPRQDLDNHGAYIPILEAGARTGKSTTDPRAGIGIGKPGDPMFTLSGKQHAVAFHGTQITSKANRSQLREQSPTLNGDARLMVVDTLRSHPRPGSNTIGAISFTERRREGGRNLETQDELAYTLRNPGDGGGGASLAQVCVVNARQDPVNGPLCQPLDGNGYSMATNQGAAVRRLTPKEWERLMGFEDDYTLIPYPRLKLAADGPRYKAIGNSISVPTLRWIGRRIQTVDGILSALASETAVETLQAKP